MNIRRNQKEFPYYGKYIGKGVYQIHDKYFEDPSLFWETKEENFRRVKFGIHQKPLWFLFFFICFFSMTIAYYYEYVDTDIMYFHMYNPEGPEKDPITFALYYIIAKIHLTILKHFRKFNCLVEDKPLESDLDIEWIFQYEEMPDKVNEKYKWKKEYKEFTINLRRNNLNYLLVHAFPEIIRRFIWLLTRLLLLSHFIVYFLGNNDRDWEFIMKNPWLKAPFDYEKSKYKYNRHIY